VCAEISAKSHWSFLNFIYIVSLFYLEGTFYFPEIAYTGMAQMGIVNYKEYHWEFCAIKLCLPLLQIPAFLADSCAV
jgi:hypothetical protein